MSVPKTNRLPRLRVLWSFARPHLRTIGLGMVLALAVSAMGLATPMVTKWVLDSLGTSTSLLYPILVLLGLFLVGVVVQAWEWILLGSLGERVVLEARESMVRRFFRATLPAVTSRPVGELVTRVTSDTVLLREAVSSSVIGLINGAIMLIGTLILMAVLDPVLLGVTVAAVLVCVVLFATLMPGIAKAQEQAQEHVGRLGGMLEGALGAIRTVKASRAENSQTERILHDARESAGHGIRAVRREAIAWSVGMSGVQLAILLILGIGAWRVSEGLLQVSTLIAFLLYAIGLLDPITMLSQHLTTLQAGVAAAGRIRDMDALELEADAVAEGSTAARPGTDHPVLELRGVTAAFGPNAEPALHNVDLSVARRGHTAIVGPSGAGKTTTLSLILRFLETRTGELLLDGRPYRELTHDEVRSRLAYVEQDTPLVPGTIRENLLLSRPDATEEDLRRVLAEVRLTDKVDALENGLDTPLSSTAISGGQRQRIALARAILRTPDVLLLDEATAQLDGLTEAAIHDCIRRRAAHAAVVTVAHRLSTVIDADTIVVMEAGRIRATGTHEELLATDELYRQLVRALRISSAEETDHAVPSRM
ncbi:ABC transporter ATP-binding protein [Nocardia sp. IFM 10818]